MTKRRERLSPVIDAERRKSGVLERRAHGLEAECVQLGRDLKLAREEAAAAKRAKSDADLRAEFQRSNCAVLRTRCKTLEADVERWQRNAEQAWTHNRAFRDTPLWRIAVHRMAARFGRSA